jgi:hypothetical protein
MVFLPHKGGSNVNIDLQLNGIGIKKSKQFSLFGHKH